MAEPEPLAVLVPLPRQAEAYAAIVQRYTVSILLIYTLGVLSGYIPFRPLDALAASTRHTEYLEQLATQRLETDRRIAEALQAFAQITGRYERRDRLIECHARYADLKTREWCLSELSTLPR